MEVEMKAKVTMQQIFDVLDEKFDKKFHISRGGGWHALHKVDEYFSFNGIEPKKPHDIVRLRSTVGISPDYSVVDIINRKYDIKLGPECLPKTELTVKRKNTSSDGIEANEEFEGPLDMNATTAFLKFLEICNFKPYFRKQKTSISFYVEKWETHEEIHCEFVVVNGIGPFLEIEKVVNDEKDTQAAEHLIKEFFKSALGIGPKDFIAASWPEIIEKVGK